MVSESAVSKEISSADQMLGSTTDREHYFRCGRSAIKCIQGALDIASIPTSRITRILDLPSGHGRVMRYLRAAFPQAEIVACDLLRDGVEFCASRFGATPMYSSVEPEAIPLRPGSFDLIWVGSLFTHLDAALWPRFLAVLRNALCPGGLLVFSSHGREAYQRVLGGRWSDRLSHTGRTALLYRYEHGGFGYSRYSESDIDYGLSLSHPTWVIRQVTMLGGLRVVNVSERSWDDFQDVFACIREPGCEADMQRTSAGRYRRHRALERMNPHLRSALTRIWRMWQR